MSIAYDMTKPLEQDTVLMDEAGHVKNDGQFHVFPS